MRVCKFPISLCALGCSLLETSLLKNVTNVAFRLFGVESSAAPPCAQKPHRVRRRLVLRHAPNCMHNTFSLSALWRRLTRTRPTRRLSLGTTYDASLDACPHCMVFLLQSCDEDGEHGRCTRLHVHRPKRPQRGTFCCVTVLHFLYFRENNEWR